MLRQGAGTLTRAECSRHAGGTASVRASRAGPGHPTTTTKAADQQQAGKPSSRKAEQLRYLDATALVHVLRQLQGQRSEAVYSSCAVGRCWQVGGVGARAQAQPHVRHQLIGCKDADLHRSSIAP